MVDVQRDSNANPVSSKRRPFGDGGGGSITQVDIVGQSVNGIIKNFSYKAPDLTTDATFDFQILDENNGNAVIFEETGLADNQTAWKYNVLTADKLAYVASDKCTFRFKWVTSQVITANAFDLILPLG